MIEIPVQSIMQLLLTVLTYLLTMAFTGSVLGRTWMGSVDIFLHKIFKIEVTMGKYAYWKYFCTIADPPKPEHLEKPKKLTDQLICKLLDRQNR